MALIDPGVILARYRSYYAWMRDAGMLRADRPRPAPTPEEAPRSRRLTEDDILHGLPVQTNNRPSFYEARSLADITQTIVTLTEGLRDTPEPTPDQIHTMQVLLDIQERMERAIFGGLNPGRQLPPALQKSIELLTSALSDDQLADFRRTKSFTVRGNWTGKVYRIDFADYPYNINALTAEGAPDYRVCFLPANNPPAGDIMLAQKIALEQDEENTLAIAHFTNAVVDACPPHVRDCPCDLCQGYGYHPARQPLATRGW